MRFRVFLVTIFVGLFASYALAITSTDMLPGGISSPSLRFGYIDGIDQKYTEDGSLMRLGDYKSIVFDATTLAQFNPDAKKLVDALNHFGGYGLGDNFNLGVLRVGTQPIVSYYAPVFAHGVTEKWTLGIGIPVISYKNTINLAQQFSNIDYYRQQFSGISPELDEALNTNLVQATRDTLAAKGYKALENKNESFIGDVQMVSMHRLFEDPDQAVVYEAQLSLPTGPRFDADDLAALNIFGRWSLNNTLAYSRKVSPAITVVPYLSYLFNIADRVEQRVPRSEDDNLPDAQSKQDVQRKIGDTMTVGSAAFYSFNDSLTIGTAYEYASKGRDTYQGEGPGVYRKLSDDSEAKSHIVKAEISFSTVKSYFKKTFLLPMVVSYEISDVVAGINIERQLAHEFNLMLFF